MIKNRISLFVATFLVVGFFFLAMPEKGYSQEPVFEGCCQYTGVQGGNMCYQSSSLCKKFKDYTFDGFFEGETCNEETGYCIDPITDVPTLSEWGLITMAGVLGIIGFMVIRRRKATA